MDLILEVGLNHFGKVSESKKYLEFFLKSDFKFLTYQIQKKSFYNKFKFDEITNELWIKYFNQFFLGYVNILNKIKVRNGGYIFNISTALIKEPSNNLMISTSMRVAFTSLLKSLTYELCKKNISTISLAPGPFKTNRIKKLVKNLKEFEKNLPLQKIGDPDDIGNFIKYVVSNKVKYISRSTIYFDGTTNKSFL